LNFGLTHTSKPEQYMKSQPLLSLEYRVMFNDRLNYAVITYIFKEKMQKNQLIT